MSTPSTPQPPIPTQLPLTSIEDVGRGWRRVSLNEPIKSCYQCYSTLPAAGMGIGKPRGWKLGTFYTREGRLHIGATHYRAPASLRAWATVLLPLVAKLVRGYWKLWRTGEMA